MRLSRIILSLLISASLVVSYQDTFAAKTRKSGRKAGKAIGPGDVWERVRHGLSIPTLGAAYHGIDAIAAASTPRNRLASMPQDAKTAPVIDSAGGDDSSRLTTVIAPKKLFKGESQLPEKLRPKQQEAFMSKISGLYKKDISQNRYTELGRKRLGQKLLNPTGEGVQKNEAVGAQYGAKLSKSPIIERVRTRLNFHPELAKHNVGGAKITTTPIGSSNVLTGQNPATTPAVMGRCADLASKETISLAQEGMLPENYRLLLEQCRLKRSGIYERINQQIAGFTQHIGFVNDSTERARPYLYHVVESLSRHGLPMDLALLPIVESGYKPTAFSSASAAGVWQFIPSTGKVYGSEQNEYFDGRLDIAAATHAAVRFLSGLRDHYRGDRSLALAAYNCGPGNVDAAIAKNLADGLDTDYWSLNLPAETQNYVPRLLALSTIFSNPTHYGLKLSAVKNEPYFIKVDIAHAFDINKLGDKDLASIAKLANFSIDQFGFLNTAYIKSVVNKREPFSLLTPITNANQLHQSLVYLASSEGERKSTYQEDFFLVGEHASPSAHSSWPKIEQPLVAILLEDYKPEHKIRQFWQEDFSSDDEVNSNPWPESYSAVHYLDYGETLKSVAENYGISEAKLREINKFKRKQKAALGQRLFIPIEEFAKNSQQAQKSILFTGIKA